MFRFQLLLWMSVPAVVVTLLYAGARVGARRNPTTSRKAVRAGAGFACLAFWAYELYLYFAIVQSERSMAVPGGLAELIMVGPVLWLATFAVGWSGAIVIDALRARGEAGAKTAPGIAAPIRLTVAVVIGVLAFGYVGARGYSRFLWQRATSAQTAEELNALHDRSWVRHDEAVLTALAGNRNSSSELLQKLSIDEHWRVRSVAARHPNTQPEVLRQMYEDDSGLPSLAMNPNTPVDVLERLLYDSDPGIQHNLAGNGSATDSMLAVLAENPNQWVRQRSQSQQRVRASRKRRGCLDGKKPTPLRHEGSPPTLDELAEVHKQETGLDYAVCPDGYDPRLDNVEVVKAHGDCVEEARQACKPTEYRSFGSGGPPGGVVGYTSTVNFIEPRDDGRCGTVVITDLQEYPAIAGSGDLCLTVKTLDCQVVEEWGCPGR